MKKQVKEQGSCSEVYTGVMYYTLVSLAGILVLKGECYKMEETLLLPSLQQDVRRGGKVDFILVVPSGKEFLKLIVLVLPCIGLECASSPFIDCTISGRVSQYGGLARALYSDGR